MDPDIVFFGLIFVNFLPLKYFPNVKPPISEAIDTVIINKKKIFNSGLLATIKKIPKTIDDKYTNAKALNDVIKNFFFLYIFETKL